MPEQINCTLAFDDGNMAVVLLKILLEQGIINRSTFNNILKVYHANTDKAKEVA